MGLSVERDLDGSRGDQRAQGVALVHAARAVAADRRGLPRRVLLSEPDAPRDAGGRCVCDLVRRGYRARVAGRRAAVRAEARYGGDRRHGADHSRRNRDQRILQNRRKSLIW